MGRLDHFVLYNNHLKTTTGDTMSNNTLETPSVTSTRGYGSSHLTWINTMQKDMKTLVWGRIKDTGANYIVEGWAITQGTDRTQWVKIACQNLATAQMYLCDVMERGAHSREKARQEWGQLENFGLSYEEIIEKLSY